MQLAMIPDILKPNAVAGMNVKIGNRLPCFPVYNSEVVIDHDCAQLKEKVVIRAKADNIFCDIWPFVGQAEAAEMKSLGVSHAADGFDGNSANLTFIVVEFLDPLAETAILEDSTRHSAPAVRSDKRSICSGLGLLNRLKPES
jgi:hypothetical protein